MLRFHTATSSDGVKNYFDTADYYSQGTETIGKWGGKLAPEIGLEGPVTKDAFGKLCDNRRPDGSRLTPRTNAKRRVGEDMIFSLPKDVGAFIMLLQPEERDDYLAMVERRVLQVMDIIEADVETRVRKDGAFENRPGSGLVWAGYRHTTARPEEDHPPDPHPHWHMFCFNATRDGDEGGRIKAAEFASIYRDRPYYEALFFSLVAEDFKRRGHVIEVREDGKWGLAGLQSFVPTFSKRTGKIEDEAARLNIIDPGVKSQLGGKTRKKKDKVLTQEQLHDAWHAQLSDDQREALTAACRREIVGGPEMTPAEATDFAVRHLFEREAVVSERELVRTALLYGMGSVSADQVRAEFSAHGVMLADKDGRLMATSKEAYAMERFIASFAKSGRGCVNPVGVAGGLQRGILDGEQWDAVTGMLSSCDRVQLVDSAAGVGKSTMLRVFDQGMKQASRHVTYLATTTPATGVLQKDGFAAETVAKFLLSDKMQAAAEGETVVIDEVSMLGLRDAFKLFTIAKENNIRLVMLGDSRQHTSVAAGAVMRVLQQYGGITPYRITGIKRQKNELYRQGIGLMYEGKVLEAFDILDKKLGWVHEIVNPEHRYQAMAEEYVDALKRGTKWDELLLIAPTHAGGRRVTDAIRDRMRQEGMIGKDDHEFTQWVSADLTEAQRGDSRNYRPGKVDMVQFFQRAEGHDPGERVMIGKTGAASLALGEAAKFKAYRKETVKFAEGDILRFTANGKTPDGHQIRNGSAYKIAGFTASAIRLDNGWLVPEDFGHFKHGIETSYGSQSKTVRYAIVDESSQNFGAVNEQQKYVSISRAKYKVSSYTDDKDALRAAIQRSSLKLAAHDLFPARASERQLMESRRRYEQWRNRRRKRQAYLERCRTDAEAWEASNRRVGPSHGR